MTTTGIGMGAARRIMAEVRMGKSGCWLWHGNRNGAGYGRIQYAGRQVQAHRLSYETFVGPIPNGLQLDHLCRVRRCVNPLHLEPVTAAVNHMRGIMSRPYLAVDGTNYCAGGHRIAGENAYQGPRHLYAWCRKCYEAALTGTSSSPPDPLNERLQPHMSPLFTPETIALIHAALAAAT